MTMPHVQRESNHHAGQSSLVIKNLAAPRPTVRTHRRLALIGINLLSTSVFSATTFGLRGLCDSAEV